MKKLFFLLILCFGMVSLSAFAQDETEAEDLEDYKTACLAAIDTERAHRAHVGISQVVAAVGILKIDQVFTLCRGIYLHFDTGISLGGNFHRAAARIALAGRKLGGSSKTGHIVT